MDLNLLVFVFDTVHQSPPICKLSLMCKLARSTELLELVLLEEGPGSASCCQVSEQDAVLQREGIFCRLTDAQLCTGCTVVWSSGIKEL